jgi:hypothetical protein
MGRMKLCVNCGEQENARKCGRCGGPTVSRETLADLAHRLWVHWSNHIAIEEPISDNRVSRWKELWVDYHELSEEMKDKDRELVEEQLRNKRAAERKWFDNE